ncbi:MAG: immunity 49 family protein [Pseudoalteromonas prydzensis]|uniref:immunity 49 family protein n=1 Tax=Pseudoalteromonas prydzensis TaxID=182141 RepID=UPI003F9540E6
MIKNHYSNNEEIHADITERADRSGSERMLQVIQKNPQDKMYVWMELNLEAFADEVLFHQLEETKKAWTYLNRATQLGVGIFQSNANDGKTFPFALDNSYIEVMGKKTGYRTDESVWCQVLYSAIILRHQESISELMLIGNNTFEASNFGPQIKEFDYARTDLYRAIFTNGDLSGLLKQTIESFDPDVYNDDAYFYVSRLKWPQIAIIKAIFTADAEEEFNQAIEKALLLHKEYYSHEDHNVDYQGAISLPLTALAALAYDHKKYKVKIENEYIPSWLVERD